MLNQCRCCTVRQEPTGASVLEAPVWAVASGGYDVSSSFFVLVIDEKPRGHYCPLLDWSVTPACI